MLSALKSSAVLEVIRTAGRIALTFIPVLLVKNHASRKLLKKIEYVKRESGDSALPRPVKEFVSKQGKLLQSIRRRTILFHALVFTPFVLFWAAVIASLERTPLTGRWRMILLSPEEEDDIATQLAGSGWYRAVGEIISKPSPPKIVPPSDWRYAWVRDTLRTLEGVIPKLGDEKSLAPLWFERGDEDIPLPPPADYPLRPRPRAAEYVRQLMQSNWTAPSHVIAGPPYSLIVVDDPDARNAFSYGFGPDGAGGIVVYSGFLDDILAKKAARAEPGGSSSGSALHPASTSLWSKFFGGLFFTTPPPPAQHHPTLDQTTDLAILLAHELSHLVLSHHLETLSSMTIFVPGVLSLLSDFIRTLIFPVTMLLGPFVNDAVADLGKAGSGELSKLGEYCTSTKQEIEADVVSARLLAHAGFDPRRAVQFWVNRAEVMQGSECVASAAFDRETHRETQSQQRTFALKIVGSGHPVNEDRVEKLREELDRWRTERERVLSELRAVRGTNMDQARS
jgi:Zn-dependent protease with chaperone function